MTPLETSQEIFLRCVRFDPAPPELEEVFAPSPRLSARACMAIYRDMYWYRLVDALFEAFPKMVEHLGPEAFTRLACQYLAGAPTRAPELERAGHAFAAFLEALDDRADCVMLSDLARLEYATIEVLLAPDAHPLSIRDIHADRFPLQSLAWTPALALVSAQPAAARVFGAAVDASGIVDHACVSVLLWRRGFAVQHRVLAKDEAAALARSLQGESVTASCSAFESADRAAVVMRSWFDAGLVVGASEPS